MRRKQSTYPRELVVLLVIAAVLGPGCGSRTANTDSVAADSTVAVPAAVDDTTAEGRVAPLLSVLRVARDSLVAAVRSAEGIPAADSVVLERRRWLKTVTTEHVRGFNDSTFQIAVWPDGWRGYANKRHLRQVGGALPDSVTAVVRADSLVAVLRDGGVWVWRAEGDAYLAFRESWLMDAVSSHISSGLREFMSVAAEEQESPTAEDASVQISWDELGERLGLVDRLVSELPDTPYAKELAYMRDRYLYVFLGGTDNTPAFHRSTRELRPEVRRSLESFGSALTEGSARQTVREYLRLLEQNGFRRTPVVNEYLRRLH